MNKIRGPGIKKMWLTLLVVLTMLFSSVLIVSATSGGVEGPGTGGEGGSVGQDATSKWSAGQIGARFYLVDSNGRRVSKVVDVHKSQYRLDVVAEAFSSARTEALGMNANEWIGAPYADVSGILPGMIWPVDLGTDDAAVGQGEAFKQWFTSTTSNGKSIATDWLEAGDGQLFAPASGLLVSPETGKPSVLYTMVEKDLALIVEPVVWYQPASTSGVSSGRIIYGSITNLMQWNAKYNWTYAKQKSGNANGGNLYTVYKSALKGFIVGGQATSNYLFQWPADAENPASKSLPEALSQISSSNTGYAIHYYRPDELTDATGMYKHKIFDLEVSMVISPAELESLSLESVMQEDYEIKGTNLPIKYDIPEPIPNGYDMESKAPDRGYTNPKGPYKFTILVKTDDPAKTLEKFKDGDTLLGALQSGSLGYERKNQVNNIRNETRQDPLKKFYYINIWVIPITPTPSPPPKPPAMGTISGSDGYIRKDEITAAQKTKFPGGTISIIPTATPPSCSRGGKGHGHSASSVSWSSFKANFTSSAAEAHKVMHSAAAEGDKYLIVGTVGKGYRLKYKEGTSTEPLTKQKSNSSGAALTFSMPTTTQIDFIAHRSGGPNPLLTPPLAAYMANSNANKTYKNYMSASGITHQEVYRPQDITDARYGYTTASKSYTIDFQAYGETTDRKSEASYSAKYDCYYTTTHPYSYESNCSNPSCPDCPHTHSGSYTTTHGVAHTDSGLTNHKTSVQNNGNQQIFKIGVEGTYNGKQITVSPVLKEFKVYKQTTPNTGDGGVLVKTPNTQTFYPTYIMRADYNEHAYEGGSTSGDRQPVWMLSKQQRALYTYNVHTVSLTGMTDMGVQAPWSTDKPDKDNEEASGKPTVKAGLVVKPTGVTAEYTIKSTIWLHDPQFVAPSQRNSVKSANAKMLKEHSDVVNQFLSMGQNKRDDGYYAFGYSSIPGAYDLDMVGRGFSELKNRFENVVGGTRKSYSDSQVGEVINQTQLTMAKASATQSSLAASGFYVNKLEGQNDANMSRSFKIELPASGLAQASTKTINLSVQQAGTSMGSSEHDQCKEDGLSKINTLLETGTGTHNWYKEDYEGLVCVTLTTKVTIKLEGGYSVLWRALSDWQDSTPIRPYEEMKPTASSNPNSIKPIIAKGDAGIGYGILTDNFTVGNHDFGQVSLLWKPYMFHIRASAYDDVVR